MENKFEVKGEFVKSYETQVISPTFSKKVFVVKFTENNDNGTFISYGEFTVKNKGIDGLNGINPGDMISLNFSLSGRIWEKDGVVQKSNKTGQDIIFSEMSAWGVTKLDQQESLNMVAKENEALVEVADDDLPF